MGRGREPGHPRELSATGREVVATVCGETVERCVGWAQRHPRELSGCAREAVAHLTGELRVRWRGAVGS